MHPVRALIEAVYARGHVPRLKIDARHPVVEVPENIRTRFQENLVLDLDPNYPLELQYTDADLRCDLAFAGVVFRCVLPYRHIYLIADRNTGEANLIQAHLPGEAPIPPKPATPAEKRASFRVIKGGA